MASELTERIQELDSRLRTLDGEKRTKAYNAVLELSLLVQELSRKIDRLE